jgi:hypothetical protein
MAVPEDSIWEFPGMYSLTMQPYGHQNDYYFCHSLSFMVIIFLEYKSTEYYKCAFASASVIIGASCWLIITRG